MICMFPVAGKGTRFLPVTKTIPKEMLPVVDKPLLQFAVEEAVASGMSGIAMVTGKSKRAIEDYFDSEGDLETVHLSREAKQKLEDIRALMDKCAFTYIRQREQLGLGHAVLTGKVLVGNKPFGVILPDDLIFSEEPVMKQLIEAHAATGKSVVAVEEVRPEEVDKYGIISYTGCGELLEVTGVIEKPVAGQAPSNIAVVGRYFLTPEVFDILSKVDFYDRGELQLTTALDVMAKSGNLVAVKVKGKRFDCGNSSGMLDAANFYARLRGEL